MNKYSFIPYFFTNNKDEDEKIFNYLSKKGIYEVALNKQINPSHLKNIWSKLTIDNKVNVVRHNPNVIYDELIINEKSVTVIAEILSEIKIHDKTLLKFASIGSKKLNSMLASRYRLSPDVQELVWRTLSIREKIAYIAKNLSSIEDEVIFNLLLAEINNIPYKCYLELSRIAYFKEDIVLRFSEINYNFFSSIYGNAHLSVEILNTIAEKIISNNNPDEDKFSIMALASNPVVSKRVIEEFSLMVTDSEVKSSILFQLSKHDDRYNKIEHIIKRSLPSEYREIGRPYDYLKFGGSELDTYEWRNLPYEELNQNKSDSIQIKRVVSYIDFGDINCSTYYNLDQEILGKYLSSKITSLKQLETYLSLVDDFNGTFSDLLTVTEAL